MPLKWKREAANAQKKQQNEKLAAAEMTSSAGRKGGGVDTGPKGWVASGKFYESILLKPGVCALGALHEQFCKLFESVTGVVIEITAIQSNVQRVDFLCNSWHPISKRAGSNK